MSTRFSPLALGRGILGALVFGSVCACGGNGPTGPGTGSAAFSADIDGRSWSASGISASAAAAAGGIFSLVGVDASGEGMSLVMYAIDAPGTFPLGVTGTVRGGVATITQAPNGWSTPLSGAAGSVTITAVSGTRIAGTFAYQATPAFGGGSSVRTVTNGRFDLPVTSAGSIAVPSNAWSSFSGTLNNAPWTAAAVVSVSGPSSGTLALGVSNTMHQMNLVLSGWTGPGTYALGSGVVRQLTVTSLQGGLATWGGAGRGSGNVVILTESGGRITGTLDVTLQPGVASPGPGALRFVGSFDIGLP